MGQQIYHYTHGDNLTCSNPVWQIGRGTVRVQGEFDGATVQITFGRTKEDVIANPVAPSDFSFTESGFVRCDNKFTWIGAVITDSDTGTDVVIEIV